jgi:hypothetical protein
MKQSYAFLAIVLALGIGFLGGSFINGNTIDQSRLGAAVANSNTKQTPPATSLSTEGLPIIIRDIPIKTASRLQAFFQFGECHIYNQEANGDWTHVGVTKGSYYPSDCRALSATQLATGAKVSVIVPSSDKSKCAYGAYDKDNKFVAAETKECPVEIKAK